MATSQIWGTGKRKTAIARVHLVPGTGRILVNGKAVEQYFPIQTVSMKTAIPFAVMGGTVSFDAIVSVRGGGFNSQAEAVRHGIARALVEQDPENKPALKKAKLLTRDARIKERKKYGLLRARKATQYRKR
ncbi:MAG: 30S ribosomal protein S9 [Caldisericota bacterium]|nr:30S ribosomal protein S9 [Caldisericota bacterium]